MKLSFVITLCRRYLTVISFTFRYAYLSLSFWSLHHCFKRLFNVSRDYLFLISWFSMSTKSKSFLFSSKYFLTAFHLNLHESFLFLTHSVFRLMRRRLLTWHVPLERITSDVLRHVSNDFVVLNRIAVLPSFKNLIPSSATFKTLVDSISVMTMKKCRSFVRHATSFWAADATSDRHRKLQRWLTKVFPFFYYKASSWKSDGTCPLRLYGYQVRCTVWLICITDFTRIKLDLRRILSQSLDNRSDTVSIEMRKARTSARKTRVSVCDRRLHSTKNLSIPRLRTYEVNKDNDNTEICKYEHSCNRDNPTRHSLLNYQRHYELLLFTFAALLIRLVATWEPLWEDAGHEDTIITVSKHSAQLRSSISCNDVTSQTRKKLSRIATWGSTDLTRSSTFFNSPCKTRRIRYIRSTFVSWNISETRISEEVELTSWTKKKNPYYRVDLWDHWTWSFS